MHHSLAITPTTWHPPSISSAATATNLILGTLWWTKDVHAYPKARLYGSPSTRSSLYQSLSFSHPAKEEHPGRCFVAALPAYGQHRQLSWTSKIDNETAVSLGHRSVTVKLMPKKMILGATHRSSIHIQAKRHATTNCNSNGALLQQLSLPFAFIAKSENRKPIYIIPGYKRDFSCSTFTIGFNVQALQWRRSSGTMTSKHRASKQFNAHGTHHPSCAASTRLLYSLQILGQHLVYNYVARRSCVFQCFCSCLHYYY